jgi:hypothetical protein
VIGALLIAKDEQTSLNERRQGGHDGVLTGAGDLDEVAY